MIANVLVVGIGGVGGYFGGKLALHYNREAAQKDKKDIDVTFVARGAHLAAIQRSGLCLNTAEQSGLVCRPHRATDAIEELEAPDLCLVCVKGYSLDEVSRRLSGIVAEKTAIVPLLNGVDIRERIRKHIGKAAVLPACVYVSSSLDKPGAVTQKGMKGVLICGKDPAHPEYEPTEVVEALAEAGISVTYSQDAYPLIWEKYLFIASFGLVTAWSAKPFGAVIEDNELRELTRSIMEEIAAVAAGRGVELDPGIVAASLEKAKNFPYETKTSYQRDVEKGGANEGDLFGATIVRLGRELDIQTPTSERLYSEIAAG